ncbi:MAG: protein kinase domain-containing protein [Bryobacteraceae bacterium]
MTSDSTGSGSAALSPGEIFAGRYEVLSHLGAGGTATVYKVRDRLISEVIALKLISPEVAQDPKLAESFKREITVARRIAHPNVVRIYDMGEFRGQFYLVMELVEGRTLHDLLSEKRRLKAGEFLPVFRQLCAAVAAVHREGVVHRDIKPSNIMFSSDGLLKLMDFGIARFVEGAQSVGPAIGTPAYMSPEQLMRQPLTPAADLFALGTVCFELLAGRNPFAGQNLAERCVNPPPVLSAPGVPPLLAEAIKQCLEPDPKNRFLTVQALMTATRDIEVPPDPKTEPEVLEPPPEAVLPEPEPEPEPEPPPEPEPEPAPEEPSAILGEILPDDPPPVKEAVPLFIEILRTAISIYASGQQPVAVTPTNITVKADGSIVMAATSDVNPQATLAMRDPKYYAPEAFADPTGPASPTAQSSSVYSLGIIFYEILLGRRQFNQEFAEVLSAPSDMRWLQWHGDLERKARPLVEVQPAIPRPLSDVIARMTEKRIAQRPATVAELLPVFQAILRTFQDTQEVPGVEIAPPHVQPRKRNLWPALIVGAVVLGILGGIVLAVLQKRGTPPAGPVTPRQTSAQPEPAAAPPPKPGQENYADRIETAVGPMLLIAAGDFVMGRNPDPSALEPVPTAEQPAHSVRLGSFYIDLQEVSNAQYRKFCDVTRRPYPANPPWDAQYVNKADHPVVNVSFDDAAAYAAWARKRLPTEAEWEKAARGWDGRLYPWGMTFQEGTANIKGGGKRFAAAVGSFSFDFSGYGVMDLAGNVSEWVNAEYAPYPGAPANAAGGIGGHKVVRGGNFGSSEAQAMTTYRGHAAGPDPSIGFRCAADAASSPALRGQ